MENPQIQEHAQTENTEASTKKIKGQNKGPPPADRMPGKSLLPTARVQRIMKADKELPTCNREAVFLISVATEEFIKRLGRAAQQQATREKRSTIQRKDLATAARRGEEFAFLEELLSTNVSAAPSAQAQAPATKRKPKTISNATPGTNIKDVLLRGVSHTEKGSGSISGLERGAQNIPHDTGSQDVDQEEIMDT